MKGIMKNLIYATPRAAPLGSQAAAAAHHTEANFSAYTAHCNGHSKVIF